MVERINRSKSLYCGSNINNVVFKKVPKYVIEGVERVDGKVLEYYPVERNCKEFNL